MASVLCFSGKRLISRSKFLARTVSAAQQDHAKENEKQTHFGFETVRESEKAEKGESRNFLAFSCHHRCFGFLSV